MVANVRCRRNISRESRKKRLASYSLEQSKRVKLNLNRNEISGLVCLVHGRQRLEDLSVFWDIEIFRLEDFYCRA